MRNNARYLVFSPAVPEAFFEMSDPWYQFLAEDFQYIHSACNPPDPGPSRGEEGPGFVTMRTMITNAWFQHGQYITMWTINRLTEMEVEISTQSCCSMASADETGDQHRPLRVIYDYIVISIWHTYGRR